MGLFGKSKREKHLELQISAALDKLKRIEKERDIWKNKFGFIYEESQRRIDDVEKTVKVAKETNDYIHDKFQQASDLLNGLKVYKYGKGKKRANTSASSKHAQLIESWQKKNQ